MYSGEKWDTMFSVVNIPYMSDFPCTVRAQKECAAIDTMGDSKISCSAWWRK